MTVRPASTTADPPALPEMPQYSWTEPLLGTATASVSATLILGIVPGRILAQAKAGAATFPIFSDDALKRLTMPLMAIVGGRDVLLDSADTKRRLERVVPHAEIHYLPEVRHFIPSQTKPILDFLVGKAVSKRR